MNFSLETTVISTRAYTAMADKIARHLGAKRSYPREQTYQASSCSAGILAQWLEPEDIDQRRVVILGGTVDEAAVLELYSLACGAKDYGAMMIDIVIPYFGHQQLERIATYGELPKAKYVARLLSSIPIPALGATVYLFDLHKDGIRFYFEGNIEVKHIYGKHVLIPEIQKLGGQSFNLAGTDVGIMKWVQSLASDLGVNPLNAFKTRNGGEIKHEGIEGSVSSGPVIVFDDIFNTGSTMVESGKGYRKAGAEKIHGITSHGVCAKGSIERLRECGLFETLSFTDSHPNALAMAGANQDIIRIIPLDQVLAGVLKGEIPHW